MQLSTVDAGKIVTPEVSAQGHLVGLFTAAALQRPDHPAIAAGQRELTYRELDQWSEAVAAALQDRGVGPGDRVALRMPAGVEAVVAMLAVMKAGSAYVPLDVRNPAARNALILDDADAKALIGEPIADIDLPNLPLTEITGLAQGPTDRPPVIPDPDAEAYVIYTSGTTGRPKGVPVLHRHAATLFSAAGAVFDFSADDRWLLFHSISFDFSVWEIWGALTGGSTLVILPHWEARTPAQYLQTIIEQRVTILSQTPTAFAVLADAAVEQQAELPHLRYVVFGGERLLSHALRPWVERYGLERPRLINGYGITETTVFTTFHTVDESDLQQTDSVIGVGLPGFQLRVVGDDGRDVEPGAVGELWLAGPQVTDGYLNRPELNDERFPVVTDEAGLQVRFYRSGDLVRALPNGELVFHGRADLQVKLRGYRLELSDIEAVLCGHPAVADAVVFVREFKPGDERLVAGIVLRGGHPADAGQLRQHVKNRLPSYMHPARYVRLSEMPRTVNGKVDRTTVRKLWEEGNVIA
ncbi:amino acid adenylation domain-containing protein [Micromonospora sp. DT53]|uniref:amino acid adenylation domain-containing protein n=1 Tax=Micromonospora sp. DT53 TaxID=3393444 RepID=UPI003CF8E9CD